MELPLLTVLLLSALFFIVAFLYSSVGHGGASGYLAVLSIFAFAPQEMATTSLLLNILVAGIAFTLYYRKSYFSYRLTLPFLVSSVPFAFLGGAIPASPGIYTILLSIALVAAAARLIIPSPAADIAPSNAPPYLFAVPIGAAIGLLSGIVGVGGGIFLSPVILFLGWSDPKHTAAASACFIVVNSVAGLLGRQLGGTLTVGNFLPLMIAAAAGGLIGSWWGANRFSGTLLQRLLGIVLLIAAGKLILVLLR